jgi:hypothetical protein
MLKKKTHSVALAPRVKEDAWRDMMRLLKMKPVFAAKRKLAC